jgi:hypothetical protein
MCFQVIRGSAAFQEQSSAIQTLLETALSDARARVVQLGANCSAADASVSRLSLQLEEERRRRAAQEDALAEAQQSNRQQAQQVEGLQRELQSCRADLDACTLSLERERSQHAAVRRQYEAVVRLVEERKREREAAAEKAADAAAAALAAHLMASRVKSAAPPQPPQPLHRQQQPTASAALGRGTASVGKAANAGGSSLLWLDQVDAAGPGVAKRAGAPPKPAAGPRAHSALPSSLSSSTMRAAAGMAAAVRADEEEDGDEDVVLPSRSGSGTGGASGSAGQGGARVLKKPRT